MQSHKSSKSKKDVKAKDPQYQVQVNFAQSLSTIFNDSSACDLWCTASSGKSCGCIRKYIIAGLQWKETTSCNPEKNDSSLTDGQLNRARELLQILHHASELKKEKCYDPSEHKSIKDLRGMIGLGNGRKRSKKYEQYVLDTRELLRSKYSLCEKAAQKILGYSINFLYKKLHTNPEKASRLGATSKTQGKLKEPRQLISVEQLKNYAATGHDQCCSRNCVNSLVTQQLNRILDWRKRLEGCSQRVAQEIVAEVLHAADSLDGPTSFCQNLVHWVTGCSFKKIRRVRDHLKKDPKTLPEHGLKKYWKDKAKKQGTSVKVMNVPAKVESNDARNQKGVAGGFPVSYSDYTRNVSTTTNNLNNSNNRYNPQIEYQGHGSKLPPNQSLATENCSNVTSGMASNTVLSSSYQVLDAFSGQPMYSAQVQQDPNLYPPVVSESANFAAPNITLTKDLVQSMDSNSNSLAYIQNAVYINQTMNTANMKQDIGVGAPQQYFQNFDPNSILPNQETSQYCELQNAQPAIFTQAQPDSTKVNAAPFVVDGSNSGMDMTQPSYYFAANPGDLQQDGNFPSGLTPLFVAQTQQPDQNQTDQANSQFQPQPFLLFSPAPTTHTKDGKEIDNRAQMVPFTPIQVLPASYIQSGLQNNGDNEIQYWFANGDQMVQGTGESDSVSNPEFKSHPGFTYHVANVMDNSVIYSQNDQPQSYFPSLTPVAIMQPHGDMLSGWISAQPFQPSQATNENKANSAVSLASTAKAHQSGELGISKNPASEDQRNLVMPNSSNNPLSSFSAISQLNDNDPKNTTVSQLPVAPVEKSDDQISDQPSDAGEGASIANRNKRFSRDRLGATIESPFLVSVLTPVARMPVTNKGANSNEKVDKMKSKSEQLETTPANESSIFRFPPTHISRRLAALRMQGITMNTGAEANSSSATVYVASSGDSIKKQDGTSNESGSTSSKSGSLSSCGSVGYLPEEFLKGFSDVKSLPVLSIPSAGWSNDNISIRRSSISEAQLGQFVPSSTQQQPGTMANAANASVSAVSTSASSGEQPKPLMPAPVKKKRKLASETSSGKTGQQRPFRFHIFTPSDFANGQVNVSQFRKPSVFAARSNLRSPSAKRGRKVSKKSATELSVLETVELEDEKEQQDGFQEKTSEVLPNASKSEPNAPTSASTAMTTDASVATTSAPVTMLPLKTPAELKNFSPQFTVRVPTSDSAAVSSAVPMQLNTPVLLHSGALMTPGKFFYSLPSAKSSDKPSTPQFFNFMPNTKFPFYVSPSEPMDTKKKSNSSESSDDVATSSADTQQMKRSRMTLNLTSRTSPDDTLQTPSKILVVTPSGGAAGNVKLTPDVPTFGFQPMDKTFPNEKGNTSARDSDANQKEDGKSSDFNTAREHSDNKTASTTAKKQHLPSIVVHMPPNSKSLAANENMTATLQNENGSQKRELSENDDLVIAVNEAADAKQSVSTKPSSPLNTPSLIQVVTPTLATVLPAGQLSSAANNPNIKVRPQTLMVNSSCVTPGGNSTSQPSTPTVLHLVSPGQRSSSSSSVMMFPCTPKNLTPFSSASMISPVFNIITRSGGVPSGHDSLLKSALTKNWSVFQFPPAPRSVTTEATTPTTEKQKEVNISQETEQNQVPEVDQQATADVSTEKDSTT